MRHHRNKNVQNWPLMKQRRPACVLGQGPSGFDHYFNLPFLATVITC